MFAIIRQCRINDGYLYHIWTFIWKWTDVGNFPRALYDACLFSQNYHVSMGIKLCWGHLFVIFISHCGCYPNHRNISAQKSIWFDHRKPLITKRSKLMRGDGRPSCPNRRVWFATGSHERHSHNTFHQFSGSRCTDSNHFSIINIFLFFCLSWFVASELPIAALILLIEGMEGT